jgi:transcriptional regulator with XRE-family HTH domain
MLRMPTAQVTAGLLGRSRLALGVTQNQLAAVLSVARRTIGRWEGREGAPTEEQLCRLARAVHPRDAALALEIANEAGTTLEALGLVAPAPPAPAAPPPPPVSLQAAVVGPPPRPFPPVDLVVDAIVHVSAQALEGQDAGRDPIGTVTAVLRAAFARARRLGLTIAEVDEALGSRGRPIDLTSPGASTPRGARRAR